MKSPRRVGEIQPFFIKIKTMKKFAVIVILVAAALIGYSMFYLGLAFFKAIIGLGVLALIVAGGFIGYFISSVSNKTKK